MPSRLVVWLALIGTVMFFSGQHDQDAIEGRPMAASSPVGALVSGVI
jgi:hypothetical protein